MRPFIRDSTAVIRMLAIPALLAAGTVAAAAYLRASRPHDIRSESAATQNNPAALAALNQGQAAWSVPNFSFVDQDARPASRSDFRGKVWVADFVFTGCASTCPLLTQKMARLEQAIPDQRLQLTSFDVDPDHDTPATLKEYGQKFNADFSRWRFLVPPTRAAIVDLARQLRVTNQKDDKDFTILHSDRLFLIDARGEVRGVYDGSQDSGLTQLIHDARDLLAG